MYLFKTAEREQLIFRKPYCWPTKFAQDVSYAMLATRDQVQDTQTAESPPVSRETEEAAIVVIPIRTKHPTMGCSRIVPLGSRDLIGSGVVSKGEHILRRIHTPYPMLAFRSACFWHLSVPNVRDISVFSQRTTCLLDF